MGTIPDMLSAARNQFAEEGAVVVPGGLGRLPAELYIQYSITLYYVLPTACFFGLSKTCCRPSFPEQIFIHTILWEVLLNNVVCLFYDLATSLYIALIVAFITTSAVWIFWHNGMYSYQRIYISNRTDSTLLRLPNICPPNLSPPESMSSVKTWKFETGKKGLFFSGFD